MANDYTPQQIEEILRMFFDVAGTRKYIGARYVPIFGRGRGTSVDWDNGDAYEPLSIVYWQGDTYTSRRYVPAGIQIDNQDYWVITGRYNAQIEQYRQEVLSFQGQIDDRVPFPDSDHYPRYGTEGQVLGTLTDGTTRWVDPVVPSAEQAEQVITQWLDDHPEATTTVQDNSITTAKLVNGAVTDAKLAQTGGVLSAVSAIEDDVTELQNIIGDMSVTWTDGRSILNTGEEYEMSNYSFATVYVIPRTTIKGYTRGGADSTKSIAFYTSDGVFISSDYHQGAGSYEWNYELTVPDNAHIAKLSCATSYKGTFTCTMHGVVNGTAFMGYDLGKMAPHIDECQEELSIINGKIAYYVNTGGYYLTVPYDFVENENFTIHFLECTMASVYIQLVDASDNVTPLATITDFTKTYTYTASDDYVAFKIGVTSGNTLRLLLGQFTIIERFAALDYQASGLRSPYHDKTATNSYVTYTFDFEAGKTYKIELVDIRPTTESADPYVQLSGVRADSTATTNPVLSLYRSRPTRYFTPSEDFVGLRMGFVGTCTVRFYEYIGELDQNKTFYCGPTRELSTLKAGIEAATRWLNSTLYVDPGSYDLMDEFGIAWFESITSGMNQCGLPLMNGINIVFSPNSVVTCHYTGNNQYAQSLFSPFNTFEGGFEVENLRLECSNVRYAVHDEANGKTVYVKSIYRNCHISIDNSDNANWSSACCIGGGLGSNHEVVIDNCVFDAVGREGVTPTAIYYHQSNNQSVSEYASTIHITNNYAIHGIIWLICSRTDASLPTIAVVTNNYVDNIKIDDIAQAALYELYQWNNQTR